MCRNARRSVVLLQIRLAIELQQSVLAKGIVEGDRILFCKPEQGFVKNLGSVKLYDCVYEVS